MIIASVPSLQHARDWSHGATKNVPNANKMIDIVNYVFRCTYVTMGVYANTRH